ncbi:hypothetical protein EBR77_03230 [bacterium]|nr:hypothetical protein [bacterium]
MKKYIILGLFFAVHTCVQGASGISGIGSKRDRKECIEQAELSEVIQNQVFRLCGKSYRALSYDDLDRLRKKRSDLYNAIQTQWALELFGPGHEVIDDMLYRDGAVVGSFDHQKSAEGDSVRRQAAKRLYQKYKPRYGLSVSPLSSAAAALCAVDQKFKTEHDSICVRKNSKHKKLYW